MIININPKDAFRIAEVADTAPWTTALQRHTPDMPRQRAISPDATPACKGLLLAVLRLELTPGHAADTPVAAGELASLLKLAPSSVTELMQRAATDGFLDYQPRHGAKLSPHGRPLAMRLLRRHRLLETFLQRTLGFDWSEVHAEAERLENSTSETFVDRIDRLLGHPTTDPHGDPIPGADGSMAIAAGRSVTDHHAGSKLRLLRVLGNDAAFLRLLGQHGLTPGRRFTLAGVDPAAGTVLLTCGRGGSLTLAHAAAQRLVAESTRS